MEIADGIHMIEGIVGRRPLQLYLLVGDLKTLLLDSGCAPDPEQLIFPYLGKIGMAVEELDLVINTHPDLDHCGGNHAIKAANPGAYLSCGEADRPLIEAPQAMWRLRYNAYAARHGLAYGPEAREWIFNMLGDAQPVDFTWSGGETLRLGRDWLVEIHRTPGHSVGHLSVFDPRSHTLLCGDAVQGSGYLDIDGQPALCPTYMQVDDYLATIAKLEAMPIQRLASCHWPIKTGPGIAAFLSETRRFVKAAEQSILHELRRAEEPRSLWDLIGVLSPHLGAWPRSVDLELMYALSGNIERLVRSGHIRETSGPPVVTYEAVAHSG